MERVLKSCKTIIGSLVISIIVFSCNCWSANETSTTTYKHQFGLFIESFNIDTETARAMGISDSDYGFGFDYTGIINRYFNFNVGLTFLLIDDKNEFDQRVENSYSGDESTETSSIDAGAINAEAGFRYPMINDKLVLGINAGYRYFDIDRTIAQCVDCYSENLEVEHSTYFKPFVYYQLGESFMLGLTYTSYQKERSLTDSFTLKFDWKI